MSQFRCLECGALWVEKVSTACGARLSSNPDRWCPGRVVEHQCGGPREACGLPGCEECGSARQWPPGSLSLPLADGTRVEVALLPDGRRLLSVTRPYPGCEHVAVELPRNLADVLGAALLGDTDVARRRGLGRVGP